MVHRRVLSCTLCAALGAGYATYAPAYPLLDAVSGLPNPELVTVYPDDANANLFYFVPAAAVLVRDDNGKPRLGVQYWGFTGVDPDGAGAALRISVQPGFDKPTVDRVAAALKMKNPNANFAFPPLAGSSMDVLLNGAFMPKSQDTSDAVATTGGKVTAVGGTVDSTQTFTIALTGIGARLFAQGTAADSDLVGARYTYKILGVEKRLHAQITVYWKRVYDHFKATASANAWWGMDKNSWAVDWKKLTNEGSIKIKILDGGETDSEAYMLEVAKALVNDRVDEQGMFAPKLKPRGIAGAPEAAAAGWGFSSGGGWERLEADVNQSFDVDTQKLDEREFSIGLTFSALCAQYPATFSDLTLVGNKCIDSSRLKELARNTKACLDARLSDLYNKRHAGLMPPNSVAAQMTKAYDEACVDLRGDAPGATFLSNIHTAEGLMTSEKFRESTQNCRDRRLTDVKKHYSSGDISLDQWERQVALVFAVPCRNTLNVIAPKQSDSTHG